MTQPSFVIPAKAVIQRRLCTRHWIPTYVGMTAFFASHVFEGFGTCR